jgi:hypothetical protein
MGLAMTRSGTNVSICRDDATTFLRGFGYNAVRHPDPTLLPLEVIGKEGKRCQRLGQLRDFVNSSATEPSVEGPATAADLSGCTSSRLNLGVGAKILGAFVGAMGGALGVSTNYTNAKKLSFEFTEVTKKLVAPSQAGSFLASGDISEGNPTLVPWILDRGQIYLVSEVAYSKHFTVRYEQAAGQAATVQLDALEKLAGTNVKVEVSSSEAHVVKFKGTKPLAFAFKCFEIGYLDGLLALTTIKPGAVALSDALDQNGNPIDSGVALAAIDDVQLIEFGS